MCAFKILISKNNSATIAIQFNKTHFLLFTMKSIKVFVAKRRAHTRWFTFGSDFLPKHILKTRYITYLIIQYNDYASRHVLDSTKHIFSQQFLYDRWHQEKTYSLLEEKTNSTV